MAVGYRTGVTIFGVRCAPSVDFLSGGEFFKVELSLTAAGDFALLAFSLNQCLMDAN